MAHEIVRCGGCEAVMIQCRCPGPHTVRWSTCGNCQAEIRRDDRRREEATATMERLREEPAGQAESADAQASTETGKPSEFRHTPLIERSGIYEKLSESLSEYERACSGVKHALRVHKGPGFDAGYREARLVKDSQYDAVKAVFEDVLAIIGVRAP